MDPTPPNPHDDPHPRRLPIDDLLGELSSRIGEIVLGRELDKSAFRKRMLDAGFLEEAGQVSGASGRAAMGYRVRERERPAVFPRTFRSSE